MVRTVEIELGTLTLNESQDRVVRVVVDESGDDEEVSFEPNEQATHSLVLLRRPTRRMLLSRSTSLASQRGVVAISAVSSSKS